MTKRTPSGCLSEPLGDVGRWRRKKPVLVPKHPRVRLTRELVDDLMAMKSDYCYRVVHGRKLEEVVCRDDVPFMSEALP